MSMVLCNLEMGEEKRGNWRFNGQEIVNTECQISGLSESTSSAPAISIRKSSTQKLRYLDQKYLLLDI